MKETHLLTLKCLPNSRRSDGTLSRIKGTGWYHCLHCPSTLIAWRAESVALVGLPPQQTSDPQPTQAPAVPTRWHQCSTHQDTSGLYPLHLQPSQWRNPGTRHHRTPLAHILFVSNCLIRAHPALNTQGCPGLYLLHPQPSHQGSPGTECPGVTLSSAGPAILPGHSLTHYPGIFSPAHTLFSSSNPTRAVLAQSA